MGGMFMKRWSKPEVSNLCVQLTKEFGIEPIQSVDSCNSTYAEAIANKGKGCSFTACTYYSKNNEGNGNGGKCGGLNHPIS